MQRTLLEKMIWMVCGIAMAMATVMLFGIQRVFAASPADGAEGGSAGLPQFDPSSFSSQIFWILLTFATLYVVFGKLVLPGISDVLENRTSHIDSNRNDAIRMKDEAEAVQAAYEAGLTSARVESNRIAAETDATIKNNLASALDTLRAKTDSEIGALETRLNNEKDAAMKDMTAIAAEVAAAAAQKLAGIETNLDQAKTVVTKLSEAA